MKKLLISLLFLLASFLAVFIFVYSQAKPVSKDTSAKYFLILKGTSASRVANNLKEAGLIKSPFLFKAYMKFSALAQKIQAGQYKLSSGYSLFKVISEINKGPIEVWVTIPEGLRREQIAEKYINVLHPLDAEAFRADFLNLTKTKEGYLFPDTYLFPWDASPSMIVAKMLATFDQKVEEITLDQLIMASLVEEETKTDLERPIVAGILYKRLKAGWLLQVDVAPETYRELGLPQTPIANPGLISIKAVINPEESPYWFYIHDSSGNIHYAKTLEEHNLNISKYLK
ncbi:MAG: endolytic transglycosylase MltG [Candidatus Woesebacteria bacterium]|nr:endolytic transglycosylase MltG [Candidatus Woesebacteria bacterium]